MNVRSFCLRGLAASLLVGAFTGRPQREHGELQQSVYVWQRVWNEPVNAAVRNHAHAFDRVVVLAAEISWHGDRPDIAHVQLNYETLTALGKPVGLALRVGAYRDDFRGAAANFVAEAARGIASDARRHGLAPVELQIDFDCPESKLADYCIWIAAARDAAAPTPVTITALPCWLGRREFRDVAALVPEYVLQVHALERPKTIDDRVSLCNCGNVRQWIERASLAGVPFRVALPTYTYRLAFDPQGRYAGLSAEAPAASWPAEYSVRELGADPVGLAQVVHELREDRPANLKGIIWYRLPAEIDENNWRWPTLQTVMAGKAPREEVTVKTHKVENGLFEIEIKNAGNAAAEKPVIVSVSWPQGAFVAADALTGFELSAVGARGCQLRGFERVGPGGLQMIAWIRVTTEAEVCVNVSQN